MIRSLLRIFIILLFGVYVGRKVELGIAVDVQVNWNGNMSVYSWVIRS